MTEWVDLGCRRSYMTDSVDLDCYISHGSSSYDSYKIHMSISSYTFRKPYTLEETCTVWEGI